MARDPLQRSTGASGQLLEVADPTRRLNRCLPDILLQAIEYDLDDIEDLLCITPASGSALKGELEGLRPCQVGHRRVVHECNRSELVTLLERIVQCREVDR